ncbi:MAG: PAS domain-containing sensor histidine kinase, partial [Sphingomonas bacterium]|nr:PAS domain-containing sensor histidine kinase [Sphingomonas bacterium]
MASRSIESVPIGGRVDRDGRLIAADPALERLQVEAGSELGRALALPQLAALARAAASLGVALSRTVLAADRDHDLELFVRAEPVDDEVRLTIERWVARPMAPPRLALVATVDDDERRAAERTTFIFDVDAALNLIDVSPALATLLGIDHGAALGRPLTSLFRLIEEADGSMPLLAAVATRAAVDGQRAVSRHGKGAELIIDADPSFDDHGRFAGFSARIRREEDSDAADDGAPVFEESLDEALRSPLARIISAADHIVERGDGPLRSDYADYASDIAAAGRHLLSVIRAMGQGKAAAAQRIDVEQLARDAVLLVQPTADQRGIAIAVGRFNAPNAVAGEAHAIVQILVNLLGNAVRHSPDGASVALLFNQTNSECRVT